jgi:hypothetical protein
MVLDGIISSRENINEELPPGKKLGDFRPFVAKLNVLGEQDGLFLVAPVVLFNMRI